MKFPDVNIGAGAVLAVAGLLVAGVVAWRLKSAVDSAGGVAGVLGDVGSAVNPVDPGNVFNRAFEAVIGGSVWDVLNPDQARDDQVTPLPVVVPSPVTETAAGVGVFAETPGGAVTGLIRSPLIWLVE